MKKIKSLILLTFTVYNLNAQNQSVNGTLTVKDRINLTHSTNNQIFHIRPSSGYSGYIYWAENGVAERGILGFNAGSGDLVYRSGAYSFGNGIERFRIKSNGNVGIGTNQPIYGKVQIDQTSDASDKGLGILNSTGARAMRLWTDANNSYIYSGGSGSANLILNNSGNVGIGVANPSALLDIGDGNVSINTRDSNNAGLNINFDKSTSNNGADVNLTIRTNSGSPIVDWYVSNWGGSYTFNRGSSNGKTNLFRIESNGNIVVPNGNVIVDGLVNCEEVKVEVLDVPDYVFEPEYELRTLKETKEYITKNKHLPEIPSAKEIEANGGIELGDMNMRLLKKIEELTLHQIGLMEKLEQQHNELLSIKKELQTLKK